jgi:hypothetical protein
VYVQIDKTWEQVLAWPERYEAACRLMVCGRGGRLRCIFAMDGLDDATGVHFDEDTGKELDPAARGRVQRIA